MRKKRKNQTVKSATRLGKQFRFESLEDRRMLAAMADIVLLMDLTQSNTQNVNMWEWVRDEVFAPTTGLDNPIAIALRDQGITDVRYGMAGFGSGVSSNEFAHSYVIDSNATDPLFGDAADLDVALDKLGPTFAFGGIEDGWDGIEHVVSEYRFRPGAVPVVVLVQNEEGRNRYNTTLLREGILAALESKNVLVNVLTYGDGFNGRPELFDLAEYGGSADVRILGVEADQNDPQIDGRHTYVGLNTTTGALVDTAGATTSQAVQVSYNGSNTGATGMVASGKSVLFSTSGTGGLGPSAAGYHATSVPYHESLVDMTGSTVHSSFSTPITLPSTFNYYGTGYTQLWVDDDGTVRFTSANNPGENNVDLTRPTQARPASPFIAALWDDLDPSSVGRIRKKTGDFDGDGDNDLALEWRDYRYESSNIGVLDSIDFQLVLYASGDVRINYIDLEDSGVIATSGVWLAGISGGVGATVGLWSGSADNVSVPSGAFVPGLHSIFGASGPDGQGTFAESNDRYVRLAWDTGGAAWDLGIVDAVGDTGDLETAREALRDAFLDSLGDQINRQATAGKVFRADVPLIEINVGGPTIGSYVTDIGKPYAPTNSSVINTTTESAVVDHSSFAFHAFPENADADLLETGRQRSGGDAAMTWNFDNTTLPDGSYVVELFFSELISSSTTANNRRFDVSLENKQMLDNYNIFNDRAASVETGDPLTGAVENNLLGGVPSAGTTFRGTVKRYAVDVTDGLQIALRDAGGASLLSAIRILKSEVPPTITDVVIKGTQPGTTSTPWAQSAWVSMADRVNAGEQLYSIATVGIDRIEVHFSEPITVVDLGPNVSEFQLLGHNGRVIPLSVPATPQPVTVLTLSFPVLSADKYALHILDGAIVDATGMNLDGDWSHINQDNGTPDNVADDPDPTDPLSFGNGTEGSVASEFRLHFAHLPGDYDGNGEVDGDDFDLLQDQDPRADGDGNGQVWDTGADLLPWQIYYGYYRESYHVAVDLDNDGAFNEQPEIDHWLSTRMLADFNDDEIVDSADLLVWQSHYDPTEFDLNSDLYAQGDADYDGDADGRDFQSWQRGYNNQSAWYVGAPLSGLTTGAPPQVHNVIVSSSLSTHAPFSFDTVDGSGMQLATVPVGLADTISMVFSENVNISADSLIVVGMTTANLPELAEFSYDPLTFTATWRFESWVLGDNYLLYLSDSITDTEGNFLDGDWTNPATRTTSNALVSTFPSGDGQSGGAFIFTMTLLPGDANLDGIVNNSDYSIWSANAYGSSGKLFIQADFNGDGVVNSADLTSYYWNYDTNLQNPFLLADLDQNGIVNDDDLDILSANYGMTNADWEDGDLNDDSIVDDLDIDLAFAQYGLWFDSAA
jgi:hypothetical protein